MFTRKPLFGSGCICFLHGHSLSVRSYTAKPNAGFPCDSLEEHFSSWVQRDHSDPAHVTWLNISQELVWWRVINQRKWPIGSLFSFSYWVGWKRKCALTSTLVAASEAVGFFAVAEPVDEWAQLPHVPHPPRHHHLLLDDVSLGKVRPSLWQGDTNESLSRSVCGRNTADRKMGTRRPSLSLSYSPPTMLSQQLHQRRH